MKRKPRERLTRRSREIETRRAATREGQPEGPTSYKRERLGGTLPSVCMLLSFLFFFRGRRGGEGFFFGRKSLSAASMRELRYWRMHLCEFLKTLILFGIIGFFLFFFFCNDIIGRVYNCNNSKELGKEKHFD